MFQKKPAGLFSWHLSGRVLTAEMVQGSVCGDQGVGARGPVPGLPLRRGLPQQRQERSEHTGALPLAHLVPSRFQGVPDAISCQPLLNIITGRNKPQRKQKTAYPLKKDGKNAK